MWHKNHLLLRTGTWNEYIYSKEAIENAFRKLKDNYELPIFFDYKDRSALNLCGFVNNFKFKKGKVYGEVWLDEEGERKYKMKYVSISPKLKGFCKAGTNEIDRFEFMSFGLILNPCNKETILNTKCP